MAAFESMDISDFSDINEDFDEDLVISENLFESEEEGGEVLVEEDDLDESYLEEPMEIIPCLVFINENNVQEIILNVADETPDTPQKAKQKKKQLQIFKCEKCAKSYKKKLFFRNHKENCKGMCFFLENHSRISLDHQ